MEHSFVRHIHDFFRILIDVYGFEIKSELDDNGAYMIEYSSDNFVMRIEKYLREFYLTLYKRDSETEINLFNLLDFLGQGDEGVPKSEYFHDEQNIEECFRKQLLFISSVFFANYEFIRDFFSEKKYRANVLDFSNYWKRKHPEFYKTKN